MPLSKGDLERKQFESDVQTLVEILWEINSAWGLEPGITQIMWKLQKQIGYETRHDDDRKTFMGDV